MYDLKVARYRLGLTQLELARLVGVDRSTIANIEAGRIKPSVGLAKRLGDALGVPWSSFFNEK